MFQTAWFILGLALPATVALGVLLLAVQPGRGGLTPGRVALGWALALAAGTAIGVVVLFGQPSILPPRQYQDWLVLAVLALGGIEAIARLTVVTRWLMWPLRLAVVPAALWVMLMPIIEHDWSDTQTLWWMVGQSVGVLLIGLTTHLQAERLAGRELAPAVGLAAVGAGITIMLSGSQTLGQVALSLGAVLVGGALVTIWLPCAMAPRGMGFVAGVIYGLLLVLGFQYTYDPYGNTYGLTPLNAGLLAAGPPLGLLASAPLGHRLDRKPVRGLLRLVFILLPVGVAGAMAALAFRAEAG